MAPLGRAGREGEAPQEGDGHDDSVAVIIDNGSGLCKAGLSVDRLPRAVFPQEVGRPRRAGEASPQGQLYFGDEVAEWREKLSVGCPLEHGIIEDFGAMEELWGYTFFEKLRVDPTRHPVLLTEPPFNPKPNRERMVETMFEVFGVPSLNISITGVLALVGQGRTTGLVLDSGAGVTHTMPIFHCRCLPHCINRMDVAGGELNTLLAKLLAQRSVCLTKTAEQYHVREMKERHCYCALDPESEPSPEAVRYKMPDGREISLTDERWRTPEALFNPQLVAPESEMRGVAGMVWDSISRCDIDTRRTLLSNVVLSGGSTMFRGFSKRLEKELRTYAPRALQADISVVCSKDPLCAVWTGGQVFASLPCIQEDNWISIEDYDEYGVSLIHDKVAIRCS